MIEIYLGKNGQTFGPYSVEQFEAVRAAADFSTYTYIWDGRESHPDWKPIERAPAPPAARKAGPGAPPPDHRELVPSAASAQRETPVTPPIAALRGYDIPEIETLCVDARTVIPGRLTRVTDTGCELVCDEPSVEPSFGSRSRVMLNLLNPRSGQSQNVQARLGGVRRQNGGWHLKVLWNSCPELIVQFLEKSA